MYLEVGSVGDDGSQHIKPSIQESETQIHPDLAALYILKIYFISTFLL